MFMLVTLIIIISAAAYAAPWDGYFWAKGLQGGKCSTLGLQKYTSKTYCIYEISQSGKTAAGYTGPNCGARAYCDESSWGTAVYVKQDSSCYNASYCTCKPGETTYQNCHVGSAWGIQTKNCNSYGTAWGNWGTCKPLPEPALPEHFCGTEPKQVFLVQVFQEILAFKRF